MSTDAFSRSRSPMRGSAGSASEEAKWRAGKTNARRRLGHRHAQRVRDPAALDLRVAGEQRQDRQARRRRRSSSPPAAAPARAGSRSRPSRPSSARPPCAARTARRACSGSGRRAARGGRRRPAGRPRCGRRAGSGSARGRTRRRTRSAPCDRCGAAARRRRRGCRSGRPSQCPEPKSAWMPPSSPIERTIAAESGATGNVSTRWFVDHEEGKSGQPASVAAAAAIGASITGFYRPRARAA